MIKELTFDVAVVLIALSIKQTQPDVWKRAVLPPDVDSVSLLLAALMEMQVLQEPGVDGTHSPEQEPWLPSERSDVEPETGQDRRPI